LKWNINLYTRKPTINHDDWFFNVVLSLNSNISFSILTYFTVLSLITVISYFL
jgi:hypothetical protein